MHRKSILGRVGRGRMVAALWVLGLAAWSNAAAQEKAAADFPIVLYDKDNAPVTPKLADLPLQDSVSQYGITWTFDKRVPVGRFVNGDWYVVGPVTVTMIDPKPLFGEEVKDLARGEAERFKGQYARNGSVHNVPPVPFQSGTDSRCPHGYFKPELFARLPIEMNPGDSLVSTISKAKPTGTYPTTTQVVAVLTCLKEPVPADAFRPGYCDRQQQIFLARNLRRDRLPRLARPDKTPDIARATGVFARCWYEINQFDADQAPYQRGGYGRGILEEVARASLLLMLDFTPQEKEPLLIGLTQMGIDLWGMCKSGYPGWPPIGGWRHGRKWPIIQAGILLEDKDLANPHRSVPKVVFGEDLQVMYDTCWTGARVVYAGHTGKDGSRGGLGWGAYEHLHPSRWLAFIGQSYRCNMTSSTWVGEALAIRILGAEDNWGCPAFLDYCDRWMYEPDPGYGTPIDFGKQGNTYDPFVKAMWEKHRTNLPPVAGKDLGPRPTDGWKGKPVPQDASVAVDITPDGSLKVKGQPFLPIMLFAEHPKRIELAKALGVNTVAEGDFANPMPGGKDLVPNNEFLDSLAEAGLYGVFGADMRCAGRPNLLGWIHVDRPDAPLAKVRIDSDAVGCRGENYGEDRPIRETDRRQGECLFDGITTTKGRTLLHPLLGAQVSVKAGKPVTAHALAVWQRAVDQMSVIKEIAFYADGKETLKTTLDYKDMEQQARPLPAPVTFSELSFKVLSTYPSRAKDPDEYALDGTVLEVAALDKDGNLIPLWTNYYEPAKHFAGPGEAYDWMKKTDRSRPVFLTVGPWFLESQDIYGPQQKNAIYGDYLKACDVVGCGVYPLSTGLPISALAEAVSELRRRVGPGKPLYAWIETRGPAAAATQPGKSPGPPVAPALAPALIRAEVWMAILRGATAIGYRGFEGFDDVQADPAVVAGLKALNDRLTRLAPAILAAPANARVEMALAGGLACHVKATDHDRATYVFAQAIDPRRGGKGTIKVAGLKAGTKIEVVDEDRTLTADEGQFTDEFAPLAEHVYRIRM